VTGDSPRIAYWLQTYNGTSWVPQGLRYAVPGASGWTTAVAEQGNVGTYPSIAVDGDGLVHVVHFDAANSDLRHSYLCP